MGVELPAGGAAVQVKQRWSAKKKAEVVLRLLRGEDIESVSREVKVPAFVLSRWRDHLTPLRQGNLPREGAGR